VKDRAGLEDSVRLYDATRHTFTTWAEELGVPIDRVKRLVGHSVQDITSRYTHQRREVLLADADRVAGAITAMLKGEEAVVAEAS
jgi:integrase